MARTKHSKVPDPLLDAAVADCPRAADESWFVYLLPLTDCSAFKVGFSCNPLQRIYCFSHRYFERFDLYAALLLRLEECDAARAVETSIKVALAEHRHVAPAWVPLTAGGHTEWFSAVYFAQALDVLQAMRPLQDVPLLSTFDFIHAELVQRRSEFEVWACQLVRQLTLLREPADRATLRDWLDAYRCFGIPLFTDDPALRQFMSGV